MTVLLVAQSTAGGRESQPPGWGRGLWTCSPHARGWTVSWPAGAAFGVPVPPLLAATEVSAQRSERRDRHTAGFGDCVPLPRQHRQVCDPAGSPSVKRPWRALDGLTACEPPVIPADSSPTCRQTTIFDVKPACTGVKLFLCRKHLSVIWRRERASLVYKAGFCTLPIRLELSPGFRPRPSLSNGLRALCQRAFVLCGGRCGNLRFGRIARRTIFASLRLAVMFPAALRFSTMAGRPQRRRDGIGTWSPGRSSRQQHPDSEGVKRCRRPGWKPVDRGICLHPVRDFFTSQALGSP